MMGASSPEDLKTIELERRAYWAIYVMEKYDFTLERPNPK